MNNIIRFWNQNRKGIIAGMIAIVLIITLIQGLNQLAKENNRRKNEKALIEQNEEELPTKSIIGKDSVSKETTKGNVAIIEDFVKECNQGNIEKAYAMLTDDCKQALFPKIDNFKTGYYDIIFKQRRIIDIENFMNASNRYTYQVKFYDDILSSGDAKNPDSYQDYITIDDTAENGKLNINSLIDRQEINKEVEKNGIKITVLSKAIYKENEKYEIKIENKTNKRILIDTRRQTKSIYLLGNNNITYNSNIAEIGSVLYEIPAQMYRNYTLRFNKVYSSNVGTRAIVFSDIVPDCEQYKKTPEEIKDRVQISINI